jgi:hypothetical protein
VRALSIVCLAWSAAACSIHADYGATHYRCDDGQGCPAGFTCGADGTCARSAIDAAPGALDAPSMGPDAAPGPGACGKMSLLADDFNDGVRAPVWSYSYQDSGTTTSEASGALAITLASGAAGSHYAGYESSPYFDLRDSHLYVKVPKMVSVATSAQAYMTVTHASSPSDRLLIIQEHGQLTFVADVGGTEMDLASIPYDPVAHLWWQIRESGGMTYWETSTDGAMWTPRAMMADPIDLSLVEVDLAAGTYQAVTNPGQVQFDDLNGGTPTGVYCKTDALRDDFSDGVRGAIWDRSFADTGCAQNEGGGVLSEAPPQSAAGWCAYASSMDFDLTNSSFALEVPHALTSPMAVAYVQLYDDDDSNGVGMRATGGELECVTDLAGTETIAGMVPYDATAHRWWRVSEAGGTLTWDASPDGLAWSMICTAPSSGIPLGTLVVTLGAGTNASVFSPGEVHYDDVNLLP